jgi:hypothetical protein
VSFHRAERPDDRLGVLADPAVVHEPDRDGVEVMPFLPALAPGRDERRRLQDAQVPHHPEPRHLRQVRAQLTERLAIALEEPIQQEPAARVAQRPEDRGHGIDRHRRDNM